MKYLAPRYYTRFQCKADRCRHTCCSTWRIPISRKEYFRLVTLDCSAELDQRILNAFVEPEVPSEERFRYIGHDWLGHCRILKDGLCLLHKEAGEEVLPKVCRLYPRSLKQINDVGVACCSSGCERTVELLLEEKELAVGECEIDEGPQLHYQLQDQEIEQIRLFQEILQDHDTTLQESLAAICTIIAPEVFVKDYESDLDPLWACLKLLHQFGKDEPILAVIYQETKKRYEKDRAQYEKDRYFFEAAYPEWMLYFERLINNSLIYECFPFVDEKADKTGVYKGLCFCYGALRLLAIGAYTAGRSKEDIVDALAALFRMIDHTSFYRDVSLAQDNTAVMLKL